VENCANFVELPSGRGAQGLAACSACAGDYENPDVTVPPGEAQTESGPSGQIEDGTGEDAERTRKEDPACEQTDEEA